MPTSVTALRDGHFSISSLASPNPSNFEPESVSLMRILSLKLFVFDNSLLSCHRSVLLDVKSCSDLTRLSSRIDR